MAAGVGVCTIDGEITVASARVGAGGNNAGSRVGDGWQAPISKMRNAEASLKWSQSRSCISTEAPFLLVSTRPPRHSPLLLPASWILG
jgi:hypothetical protein